MRRSPRAGSELRRIGLARALSKRGLCSRKVAAGLILAGKVTLDGRVVRDPEYPTIEASRIEVAGDEVRAAPRQYLMLNKPRGLVTTRDDEQNRDTVFSCLAGAKLPHLAPVGRLDKASEGLLLFTNDTHWAHRVSAPEFHLDKVYHAQLNVVAVATLLARWVVGVEVENEAPLRVKKAQILRTGAKHSWVELTLDEGRNRHIRRLVNACGIEVLRLVRVAIGPLILGDLAKGQWRLLREDERAGLVRRSGPSSKGQL